MKTQKYTISFERHTVIVDGDNTHSMNFTEAGLFTNNWMGKYLTEKDDIIEALEDMYGETPTGERINIEVEFQDNPVKPGQYYIAIEDLEELGWEFHADVDRDKYDIVVSVYENGGTEFRYDAGSDFSDNESAGDHELVINDIYYLIQTDRIIRYHTH